MEDKQLQHFKEKLEKALEELKEHETELPDADESEISSVDNHPADAATDLVLATTDLAIDELKKEEQEEIELALKAIEEGTYGLCTECQTEIPLERLEAFPTALTCVDHATIA